MEISPIEDQARKHLAVSVATSIEAGRMNAPVRHSKHIVDWRQNAFFFLI